MSRKPHHVKITAFNTRNPYQANPFLNSVGTCFIQGMEIFNVMIYLS
jgi:hypothetical protein